MQTSSLYFHPPPRDEPAAAAAHQQAITSLIANRRSDKPPGSHKCGICYWNWGWPYKGIDILICPRCIEREKQRLNLYPFHTRDYFPIFMTERCPIKVKKMTRCSRLVRVNRKGTVMCQTCADRLRHKEGVEERDYETPNWRSDIKRRLTLVWPDLPVGSIDPPIYRRATRVITDEDTIYRTISWPWTLKPRREQKQ